MEEDVGKKVNSNSIHIAFLIFIFYHLIGLYSGGLGLARHDAS